jgi:uncharacterized protein (DUF1015 family)
MSIIKPFKGLRPVVDKVAQVASPPYDVLNSTEARQMAADNPYTFLHVVKPEIDLDHDSNLYGEEVYQKGAENLKNLESSGVMVRDTKDCLYLYEQRMNIQNKEHVQIGLVAGASIEEYQNNLIKKHELTRAVKEKDRTRHVEILNANTGPVFLTYKADTKIDALVARLCEAKPEYDFTADDGIGHRFWVIEQEAGLSELQDAFAKIPHLYVADGHHRSASAAAVCNIRKAANPNHSGDEVYNHFLAVLFPHDQLYIMDYNRVVFDLNGLTAEAFLDKVNEKFDVDKTTEPSPDQATEFGMFLDGTWYRLKAKDGTFDAADPVAGLDVAILQNNLLAPILGIGDPRTDNRIDFIGGIRGTKELERRVKEGGAVSFAMYATSIEQLMAIADADKIMPPKSTWFEPKLRSGVCVRPLD